MSICNFCKKSGHCVNDCATLKKWVCSRCEWTGHTASRCSKTDAEINFPPLASGKAVPIPSPKKPFQLKTTPSKTTPVKPSTQQPNRYELEVQQRVAFWISTAITIFGSMWFNEYKKSEEKNYTDPFLNDVQREVSDTVDALRFEEELKEEDAYYLSEFKNAQREEKEKLARKALQNSMTPAEWEQYEEDEMDTFDDMFDDGGHYYLSDYYNQISSAERLVKKKAEWSAFLAQQEKSQEEFRERQMLNSYLHPPRSSRTLGKFM
jgi:hypothetical protein